MCLTVSASHVCSSPICLHPKEGPSHDPHHAPGSRVQGAELFHHFVQVFPATRFETGLSDPGGKKRFGSVQKMGTPKTFKRS